METQNTSLANDSERSSVTFPNIQIRTASDVLWAKEVQAYDAMFDELIKTYENKFVAIYQGRVVANGDDKTAVVKCALEKHGNVPFFVHLVSRKPEVVKSFPASVRYRRVAP